MCRKRDLVDEKRRAANVQARSNTEKRTGNNECSFILGCCLENSASDDEHVAGVDS